jgi:hypothetical protein
MKKSINLIFVCLFIFLSSCNSNPFMNGNKLDDLDIKSNKITFETADELLKEKDLKMAGYGGGAPFGKITHLSLSLDSNNPLLIQEARELLVYSTNTFLNKINSSKELRPYLESYPATEKNIELRISGSDDNKQIKPPYISYPAMLKGTCFYYIRNDKGRLELLHKETFTEAKQIVKEAHK